MPIKIPKGFTRRKSSGNALEEVENPRESSFRVFERPSAGGYDPKRASESNLLNLAAGDSDNLFADLEKRQGKDSGSGATNSDSTAPYDSSSSGRYSSSSTLPSTDAPIHKESGTGHSRPFHDIPLPPVIGSQFSFRAAGRTFSFGTKAPRVSTPPSQGPAVASGARDRAMTPSTASTATPPRLQDSDLKLGKLDDDDFGNMFQDIGKPGQPSSDARHAGLTDHPPPVPAKGSRSSQLPPIEVDRSKEVEPSPYSWESRNSQDGLLGPDDNMFAGRSLTQSNTMPLTGGRRSLTPSSSMPLPTTSHRALDKPSRDSTLRRSTAYTGRRGSTPIDELDARLMMESVSLNSQNQTPGVLEDNDETSSLFDSRDADFTSTRHHGKSGQAVDDSNESSIAAHARLASQYEDKESSIPQTRNKVMTPAQFERYRQQQELTRTKSDASRSDASDASNDYDDEDETEKNMEAARQRRKQEAHLSIYRQQMMKVTGEQAPGPSLRPNMDRASISTPNLMNRMSSLGLPADKSGSGKTSDADDDDDIPLGILAAHGFPNKNRPPTRLGSSSSIPNLRASFSGQPASPGSQAGDGSGNRGSLPPFARNLPRDPYFGASLVTPANREPLDIRGAASVYGGPSPALPPGGLVGVIATEERARAMRRGSPNAQAFAPPLGASPGGLPRPQTMMHMGSTLAPPQQGMSPAEQAQIQMSQQMTQMMQMQMNWMQSMMQMQGMQGGVQPPMNNPNLAPSMQPGNMRPMSMPAAAALNNPPPRQADQRTLSMLDPTMSSRWNSSGFLSSNGANGLNAPQGQGYAPSIAPSERSNVGLAPRYRPVSTIQPDQKPANRASTFTSSTLKPWNDENHRPDFSPRSNSAKPTSMATVTVRPISNGASTPSRNAASDDDDEEGWAEMMKQREKKKSGWKLKRGTTGNLGELLHAVH
ncbi:hypothetical protein ANI_1_30114 [Paecilomyces variotii No. 5]|uniref:Uncharacterized protein n=1 Tax=Byssochlamys spectabilis (strain No. 5 / NBRC 109023) TaxID=1356009 RepID=V5I0K4_BYSSN|nr:hypothetical protein ANI_1_30114 [Paecilomyces variotii No. 5]